MQIRASLWEDRDKFGNHILNKRKIYKGFVLKINNRLIIVVCLRNGGHDIN